MSGAPSTTWSAGKSSVEHETSLANPFKNPDINPEYWQLTGFAGEDPSPSPTTSSHSSRACESPRLQE